MLKVGHLRKKKRAKVYIYIYIYMIYAGKACTVIG